MNRPVVISPALRGRPPEADAEQLIRLFWNRAELKKELARLRRERDALVEQVRQQEHAGLRAQQRLEQLESLLADPLQAANAAVYYQLRGVWQTCNRRLARFARELTDRQREREEEHALAVHTRARDAALAEIDARRSDLERQLRGLEREQHDITADLAARRSFWHYFRRRSARDRLQALRAAQEGLQTQAEVLATERRQQEADEFPGLAALGVTGLRNINLAVIALAQELLLHFAEHDVAALAHEAVSHGLAELSYGNANECRELGQRITAVLRRLEQSEQLNNRVRRRAEQLQSSARYTHDGAAIPLHDSFAVISSGSAGVRRAPVNVLADDYWELHSTLVG
jgi:hypothetical protein